MFTGTLKYYQVATSLLTVVRAALTVSVDRASVVPGAIAWDDCPCGLLAVSIGQVYVSEQFPDPAEAPVGVVCDAPLEVVEVLIQVIRCAPQPQNGGTSPTVSAQDAAARTMAQDTQQTLAAVTQWICDHHDVDIMDGLLLPSLPQGPEGDCVGIEQRCLISLPRG